MAKRDPERLKSYLKLITKKKGGLDAAIAELPKSAAGLESMTETSTAASPLEELARRGMESVAMGRDPSPDEQMGLEAIINADLRPAFDVVDGKFKADHHLWTQLSADAAIRGRLEKVIPCVGRIELPGHRKFPYGGTGFLVGKGLIMTNRHVAAIFADGVGAHAIIREGSKAGLDFLRERGRSNGSTLDVKRVVMIHPYWDMAILEVENVPADREPLTLSIADIAGFQDGHNIAVVGYPAFDPRNDAAEQDDLFDKEYGMKRLQPGELHGRASTESFGKIVSAAAHDCSTLGGNSGSCVVDLDSGQVVALHFGGRYHDKNFAVPTFELARDGRIVDSGVNFVSGAPGGTPPWSDWWNKADLVEVAAAAAVTPAAAQTPRTNQTPASAAMNVGVNATADGVTIEIPLQITVRLGSPVAAQKASGAESVAGAGADVLEAMVEPRRDTSYESRTGYDENFLDVKIPLPKAADPGALAKTRDGKDILHYQNFSVAMHAARRLALFAASNVTADPKLKKPDPSKIYTRKALSGLGENDQERWFVDPRMEDQFQLPDVFFTRNRGSFDKGHIVRREDVAWGTTYDNLRRGNGDSYHVTNCSPQTAEYNRSVGGVDNWGDLENHVLSGAASEKLVQFAGPVLSSNDEVFLGAGGGRNKIRAKIPSRFWKVIVASTTEGPAAFGFVLEQDLSAVEFEFIVAEEFVPHMYPIAEIEAMTGVRFPTVVRDADEYDTVHGAEVAIRSGASRRTRKKK